VLRKVCSCSKNEQLSIGPPNGLLYLPILIHIFSHQSKIPKTKIQEMEGKNEEERERRKIKPASISLADVSKGPQAPSYQRSIVHVSNFDLILWLR
jgi:hypothetical protein